MRLPANRQAGHLGGVAVLGPTRIGQRHRHSWRTTEAVVGATAPSAESNNKDHISTPARPRSMTAGQNGAADSGSTGGWRREVAVACRDFSIPSSEDR